MSTWDLSAGSHLLFRSMSSIRILASASDGPCFIFVRRMIGDFCGQIKLQNYLIYDYTVMNSELTSKSGLSLDRLRNFCMVAELGGVTRAAQGDSNRQTLFSRQIRELEKYFGTKLFVRKGRRIELTDSGKRLLRITKEFYSALEDYAEECQLDQRDLRIGAGDSIIQWLMLPRLKELRECTSSANLIFKNLRTSDILHQLLHGELQYSLTRPLEHADLISIPIGTIRYRLFLHKGTTTRKKHLAEILDDIPLVGMEGGGRFEQRMEEIAGKFGMMLKYAVRCSSLPMMARAVQVQGVAAILPEIASSDPILKGCKCLEVEGVETLDHEICLSWSKRQQDYHERLAEEGNAIARVLITEIGTG